MSPSKYLGSLDADSRAKLEQRLLSRQSGHCFICDDPIDLMLHKGQLDIDHTDPLAAEGLDAENNFALTHQSCNRSKGAANLQVAHRIGLNAMHKYQDNLTSESIRNMFDHMRTTLDLPEDLVNEAKAILGFKSKTDTIVFALQEMIRRRKREKLIGLFGKVKIDIDLDASRRRPGRPST